MVKQTLSTAPDGGPECVSRPLPSTLSDSLKKGGGGGFLIGFSWLFIRNERYQGGLTGLRPDGCEPDSALLGGGGAEQSSTEPQQMRKLLPSLLFYLMLFSWN